MSSLLIVRRAFGTAAPAAALACAAFLAGCSSPQAQDAAQSGSTDSAAGSFADLPAPFYQIDGRIVTVRLPYRTRDNHLWVDADPSATTGPFMFQMLDIEPRGGPGGTDLAVFTYKADRPGEATLKFALTPVGKGSPQDLIRQGDVASRYEPTIKVD